MLCRRPGPGIGHRLRSSYAHELESMWVELNEASSGVQPERSCVRPECQSHVRQSEARDSKRVKAKYVKVKALHLAACVQLVVYRMQDGPDCPLALNLLKYT